jgi:dCMP deaminase
MTSPREVPDRDSFYLGMAFWAASRSKDPNTQCGAFIISKENEPLGWGYNGPPKRIDDTKICWSRPKKYDYIIHAEINAINYARGELYGSTIYVTAKPCKNCMLNIVNVGIKKVVYFPYKSKDNNSMLSDPLMSDKTDEISYLSNVELCEFRGSLNWMLSRIDLFKSIGIFDQVQ